MGLVMIPCVWANPGLITAVLSPLFDSVCLCVCWPGLASLDQPNRSLLIIVTAERGWVSEAWGSLSLARLGSQHKPDPNRCWVINHLVASWIINTSDIPLLLPAIPVLPASLPLLSIRSFINKCKTLGLDEVLFTSPWCGLCLCVLFTHLLLSAADGCSLGKGVSHYSWNIC